MYFCDGKVIFVCILDVVFVQNSYNRIYKYNHFISHPLHYQVWQKR